jgi:hypothetical protein
MTRRRLPAKTTALLAATIAAGAPAPVALAQSSGGAAPSSGSSSGGQSGQTYTTSPPSPEPAVVLAGGAVTLQVQGSALLGHPLAFSGRAPRADARRTVIVQRFDSHRGAWVAAAYTTIGRDGTFATHWRTSSTGRIPFRAVVSSGTGARAASSGDSSAAAQVTVYRPALATIFGPGFYGSRTACGQTMSHALVGVANRTLPCGTLVEVSYGGQRLTVPVIDRGPYAHGADWDLTTGAAQALGITETVRIGTIVVGRVPSTPDLGSPPSSSGSSAGAGSTGGAPAG